jgi:hypothetical protein
MSPSIKNEITFTGTREGLRETLMLVSHGLDLHWESTPAGMVATPLFEDFGDGRSIPPLGRPALLYRSLNPPSPVRYTGLAAEGWTAPAVHSQAGSRAALCCVHRSKLWASVETAAGAPEVYELTLTSLSYGQALQGMCRELSRRLPNVAIALSYARDEHDAGFASAAYIHGDVVATCTYNDILESEGRAPVDLPIAEARQLAKHQTEDELLLRFQTVHRQHDMWSPITVAAYKGGIKGVEWAVRGHRQAWSKRAALITDLAAARRAGRASWLDACLHSNDLFETLADTSQFRRHPDSGNALRFADSTEGGLFSVSQERCLQMLEACAASAADRELSSVLVTVLSDPSTRMLGGIHPVALLADASKHCQGGNLFGEGLGRILSNMRSQMPKLADAAVVGVEFLCAPQALGSARISRTVRGSTSIGPALNPSYNFDVGADRLLMSLLHCGLQGGPMGYGLALAAGLDEEFLFRSLAAVCPRDALSAYVATHGTVESMSKPMISAFRSLAREEDLKLFDALQAESAMRGVIAAARSSAQHEVAPSKRRPTKGL